MTDWNTAAEAWLGELGRRPAARPPATLGEILSVAWEQSGLETIGGLGRPLNEAYGELEAALKEATGEDARTFTGDWGGTGLMPLLPADRARLIGERLDRIPDARRAPVENLIDVDGRAGEKARAIEDRAAEAAARTTGLSGNALWFLTGAARAVVDPINLASVPFGGPLRGPVLQMLGREALLGAGVQTAQEPAIQAGRAALGVEAGIGRALINIGTAGIGQAGFSGILRAGAAGLRRLRATNQPVGAQVSEADLDAAALIAERDEVVDAGAVPPTPKGRAATAEKLDRAAAAIEARTPVDVAPVARPVEAPVAEIFGPPTRAPEFAEGFRPERLAFFDGDRQAIVRSGGGRLSVRPAVVELKDLTVSHDLDGNANPFYPAELQPRDRESAASRSFVAERARNLEPELLGRAPTAGEGAPVIGNDGVVESGNGRVMMIARAFDRHPERAAAYRRFLEEQGYQVDGFEFPVLVRIREGELADRAAFAREANVSPVAGLSVRERAFADAGRIDDHLLGLWRTGATDAQANVPFIRAFADRVVAPEERPNFVSGDNRLSAEGRRRVEAALVARAWGAEDVVSALFEEADPTSKAILGALADTAPIAARVKTAIAEGRIGVADDPAPAILEAFRLVDRARSTGLRVGELIDQVDIETGPVADDVAAAVRLFFRDDDLRLAAGRDSVASRLEAAMGRALDKQNAVGDLFEVEIDNAGNLRAAAHADSAVDDVPLAETAEAEAPSITTPDAASPIGDPAKAAEAERVLAEVGEDFEIFVIDEATGEPVARSARELLTEAEEDAAAAAELIGCIGTQPIAA